MSESLVNIDEITFDAPISALPNILFSQNFGFILLLYTPSHL